MAPNFEKLIPPIDEAGRAKRIQVEHKIFDRIMKDLDNPELAPAEFRDTMRGYCELKKQDNLHEKNVVLLAIAEARLAAAPARRSHSLPLPLRERAGVRVTTAPVDGSPTVPDQSFSAFNDDSWNQPCTSSTQSTTSIPSTDPTAPPLSVENSAYDPNDPDGDPEWIAAPWGRRRNGKPRTEKEYRTILHNAVRDVYGLELRDDYGRELRDNQPDHPADSPSTSDALSPSPTPTSAIHHPTSDIEHPTSDFPHPTSAIDDVLPAIDDEPLEIEPHTPSFPVGPAPPHPPGSTEVSPFCRPDAPFDPKPRNPWYDF